MCRRRYLLEKVSDKKMKIDKRIQQSIQYSIKEIKIREETYNNLKDETKLILRQNKVKVTFSKDIKEIEFKFIGGTNE